MERISSGCGRREFSCKRVEYQVVASVHNWSIVTSGRMADRIPREAARIGFSTSELVKKKIAFPLCFR